MEVDGLYQLKSEYPEKYLNYVRRLAGEICEVAQGAQRLPPLDDPPDPRRIQSAFHERVERPGKPLFLKARPLSWKKIRLEWDPGSGNEAGYEVERRPGKSGGGDFEFLAEAENSTFTDRGLKADTLYAYRVRAFNAGGDSPYTEISATTDTQPPLTYYLRYVVIAASALAVLAALFVGIRSCLEPPTDTNETVNANVRPSSTPGSTPQPSTPVTSLLWGDTFKQDTVPQPNKHEWDQIKEWDVLDKQWELADGSDRGKPTDKALAVQGASPGAVKNQVFKDFRIDFWFRLTKGTMAGWILRASGDRQKGFDGYYFVFKKSENRGGCPYLTVYAGPPESKNIVKAPVKVVCDLDEEPGDAVYVAINAVGNTFECTFTLESADSPGASFTISVPPETLRASGSVGFFADDASQFVVEQIALIRPDVDK